MPLYRTVREAQAPKEAQERGAKGSEKPLPEPDDATTRPGTSGTELLLVSNRRRASESFQQAQLAEKKYKATKRSAAAKRDYMTAKDHFRQSFHHLKQGVGLIFSVVRSAPYYVSGKNEARKAKADERRKRRLTEVRKALEEELAKEEARNSSDDDGAKAGKS